MLRLIWFLLLLLAGCALIFWPYQVEDSREPGSSARLDNPLPAAWENARDLQVRPLAGQVGAASQAEESACGGSYTVQRGDSLGKIAERCGVRLAELMAANPQLRNPNRIFTGQPLAVPVQSAAGAQSGGIPDTSASLGFFPGGVIEVEVDGLPPNQPVRIGLGLSGSGYLVLERAVTGPDGILVARVTLPGAARPGDSAFLMVTTEGLPSHQAISDTFTIGRR